MNEPTVVPRDALRGRKIALSVSESADLARLGLSEEHCRLVVAEVGRALMLAGGTILYGGDLRAGGYTWLLIEEAQRFIGGRTALELCLAEPVYKGTDDDTLARADRALGDVGKLTLISEAGTTVTREQARASANDFDRPQALTAMRRYVSDEAAARLIVGGRLTGLEGRVPGVIEEARLSWEIGRPVLAAGGYGGAAAAIARRLRPNDFDGWAPTDFPSGADDGSVMMALDKAIRAHAVHPQPRLDADDALLRTITISHRPGDVATAAVQLLSRIPVPE